MRSRRNSRRASPVNFLGQLSLEDATVYGYHPSSCPLPGVAAHSMIIEIFPARLAISARGCRFAAAGQTTSGKLSACLLFSHNSIHDLRKHDRRCCARRAMRAWTHGKILRGSRRDQNIFQMTNKGITVRAWPIARSIFDAM